MLRAGTQKDRSNIIKARKRFGKKLQKAKELINKDHDDPLPVQDSYSYITNNNIYNKYKDLKDMSDYNYQEE